MALHLPSFSALRAFDAAARHLNFSQAAEELRLTHGAISHQMKALEASLGVSLVRREGRRMLLTDAGQRFAARLRDVLGDLASAVAEVAQRRDQKELTISVLPSFASYWLIPRLPSFHGRHPEIDVNIRATQALAEFGRDGVDLAIRIGQGHWPGLESEKLFDEEAFPVASPRFNGGVLPKRPQDLAGTVLLRSERQPWTPWFRAIGLDWPEPSRGPIYSDETLLIQAAAEGIGVALARGALVTTDLASGRLVRLFPRRVPSRTAYYLVYPRSALELPRVQAFRVWIRAEAKAATRR
jgi:LysR family transcriptional regulator, glycine cleavage system transcriptional activator